MLTVITKNGGVDVITSQKVNIPTGWDEQVAEYGRGYNYPQPTGQTTVYRTGDDADIEATIFAPVRVANSLKVQNSLIDFFTLGNTNSFGNTNRFTDSVGGQIAGAGNGSLTDYVICNYTGLAVSRIVRSAVDWPDATDAALAITLNGFSDWFLGNSNIQESIFNKSLDQQLNYSPLNVVIYPSETWTSTTRGGATTQAITYISISRGSLEIKTSTREYFIWRKHF